MPTYKNEALIAEARQMRSDLIRNFFARVFRTDGTQHINTRNHIGHRLSEGMMLNGSVDPHPVSS